MGWQNQKEEEKREEAGRKREEKAEKKKEKKKPKKEKKIEVRKVAEEWEIWNEEEEAEKSEAEVRKLVLEKFYKWIHVFGKKTSEQIREEREEVHEFISEQLRKEYIKPSKSS